MNDTIKTCIDCKQAKPLEGFYPSKLHRLGITNVCKKCHNLRNKKWRESKKEENLQAYGDWKSGKAKESYEKHKDIINERAKVYKKINQEKVKAHTALRVATKQGKVEKPDKCSLCGQAARRIDGHHPDYSKPLDVQWLCPSCHVLLHRQENMECHLSAQ